MKAGDRVLLDLLRAQGDLMMVGAFAGLATMTMLGFPFWLSVTAAIIAMGLFGAGLNLQGRKGEKESDGRKKTQAFHHADTVDSTSITWAIGRMCLIERGCVGIMCSRPCIKVLHLQGRGFQAL